MSVALFPSKPFDGMRFVDQWRRRWIYTADNKSWNFSGFIPEVPEADNNTIGLLKPEHKAMLNAIESKAGGFGIFTKTSFGKQFSNGFNGLINGNVKFVSDSLEITCNPAPYSVEMGTAPAIDFNFSEKFLNSLCINVPGTPGLPGREGNEGPQGSAGTGDGPPGEEGEPGENAEGISEVEDVDVIFTEDFYSSAVTEVFLDAENAVLSTTRSEALVPDIDTPASEVVAVNMPRDIVFTDEESFDYEIIRPPGTTDPVPSALDATLLGFGPGFSPSETSRVKANSIGVCCFERDSAEVLATNLSSYVDQTIEKYQNVLENAEIEYDKEIRDYIFKKDEEARKALDVLVQKLSDEIFLEPFEYCMSLTDNGVCGQQCCGDDGGKFRQDPYQDCNRVQQAAIVQALQDLGGSSITGALQTGPLIATGNTVGVAKELNQAISDEYGIPNISQNGNEVNLSCDDIIPNEASLDQFNSGICVFAESILNATGFITGAEGFCPESVATTLGVTTLRPKQRHVVTIDVGSAIKPGAYIFQYLGGTLYDAAQPACGYVVGSGTETFGLVLEVFYEEALSSGGTQHIVIPWPESSLVTNPMDRVNVEDSYKIGPITESSVGVLIDQPARMVLTLVAQGERSQGQIDVAMSHCARCVTQ